jgi:hypothetical protein
MGGTLADNAPRWEIKAKERLRTNLRKATRDIRKLLDEDAAEARTRLMVTEFLVNGLGFDAMTDLDPEFATRGDYADYLLKLNSQPIAFVEVKRVRVKLTDRHLRQVESYALRHESIDWAILTNGRVWRVYRIERGRPVEAVCLSEVDLLDGRTPAPHASALLPMTREGFQHGYVDHLWEKSRSMNPRLIRELLLSDKVIAALRSEIRRRTHHLVDPNDLMRTIRDEVVRPIQ